MTGILASLNMLNVLSAFPFANTKGTRIDTAFSATEIELYIHILGAMSSSLSIPLLVPGTSIVLGNPYPRSERFFSFHPPSQHLPCKNKRRLFGTYASYICNDQMETANDTRKWPSWWERSQIGIFGRWFIEGLFSVDGYQWWPSFNRRTRMLDACTSMIKSNAEKKGGPLRRSLETTTLCAH